MSGNEAIQSEKNKKALDMINRVASDYVKEENHVKREILRAKLWEKCLAYVLHLDVTQQDDALREGISSELIDNEKQLSDDNPDLRKNFNMDVFISTMTSVIGKYSEKPGEEFTRLFLTTYYIRKNGNIGEEIVKNRIQGFSISKHDRKNWSKFYNYFRHYSENDERFADKQLCSLSPQDIHNILEAAGVGFENEERYVEMAQQFAKAQYVTELDKPLNEDGETIAGYKIPDKADVENEVVAQMYIVKLFKNVLDMASSIQKKYFMCFIAVDILNHYCNDIPDKLTSCVEQGFLHYVEEYLRCRNKDTNELPDVVIADYLGVQKSAITKQRINYRRVLIKARELMGE